MRRRRQVSAARRPLADGGERRAAARAACGVTGRARGPGRAARDRLRALDGRGRGALQGVGSPCPPTARGRVEHTWRPAHPGCQRLKSGSQASEVRKERAAQAGPSRHRREVGAGAPAHDCSVRSPGRRPGRECGVRARPSGSGSRCPWLVRCTQTAEPRAVPRSPSLRSRCFGALSGPPGQAPSRARAPSPQKPLDEGAGVLGRAPGTSCSRGLPGSRPQDPADRAPRSTSTWASGAADPRPAPAPRPLGVAPGSPAPRPAPPGQPRRGRGSGGRQPRVWPARRHTAPLATGRQGTAPAGAGCFGRSSVRTRLARGSAAGSPLLTPLEAHALRKGAELNLEGAGRVAPGPAAGASAAAVGPLQGRGGACARLPLASRLGRPCGKREDPVSRAAGERAGRCHGP